MDTIKPSEANHRFRRSYRRWVELFLQGSLFLLIVIFCSFVLLSPFLFPRSFIFVSHAAAWLLLVSCTPSSTRFIRTGEQAPFVAGISFQFLRSCFDARRNAQGKPISRHLARNEAETILFFIRYELASVVERRKTTGQQLSQRNQVQE